MAALRKSLPQLEGDFYLTDGGIETTLIFHEGLELNESTELDTGNPAELGGEHAELKRRQSQLNVMGGCCGTDHRHVEQIAAACSPLFR